MTTDTIEAYCKAYLVKTYAETANYSEIARTLKIAPTHIWRAVNEGYVSPKLVKRMTRLGMVEAPAGIDYDRNRRRRPIIRNLPLSRWEWLQAQDDPNGTATDLLCWAIGQRIREEITR